MDMCSINPAYLGKEYRYAYGCSARRPCNFLNALAKIDLVKKTVKNWHGEDGATPSEPFFLAQPGATSVKTMGFIWARPACSCSPCPARNKSTLRIYRVLLVSRVSFFRERSNGGGSP